MGCPHVTVWSRRRSWEALHHESRLVQEAAWTLRNARRASFLQTTPAHRAARALVTGDAPLLACTSAIVAQLVAAAEIHWSVPWGNCASKYG